MTIKNKLFFAFSVYMVLAFALVLFAYKEQRNLTLHLRLVEIADDITSDLLEMRRYEKNFLLYRDMDSLNNLMKYMETLIGNINKIKAEIEEEIGKQNYEMMRTKILEYDNLIKHIAERFRLQRDIENTVKESGRKLEQTLKGVQLQNFYLLRKHEKNIMLFKNKKSFEAFIRTSESFASDDNIIHYQMLVKKLYDLYKYESDMLEKMRETAREIQSFTENLSIEERKNIEAILERGMQLLLLTFVIILFTGIIVNRNLARGISAPIMRLEEATKKVANGHYSEVIEVEGSDEIAMLSLSFNQMALQIKDSMESLELAIKRLHEQQGQLIEAEKLASIGKLAAGIAHEINNPLTSVLTFSSLILEQMQKDNPYYKRLQMIVRETTRARDIVRQVLSYARETPLRLEKMNVNRTVAEITESFTDQNIPEGIELTVNFSEDLPSIYIDPVRLGQVVMNILQNAVQAITPPGKINISTRRTDNFIELIFTDTGRGIPDKHIKNIFDPFFTTKEKSNGTGLGLTVSYGIIKKHGGNIEVQSSVGKGTTFTIKLPVEPVSRNELADGAVENNIHKQTISGK